MNKFSENILRKYGPSSREWLEDLPHFVNCVAESDHLTDITVFPNLKYHFVIAALKDNKPVVVKFELDEDFMHCHYTGKPIKVYDKLSYEAKGLRAFREFGVVTVLMTSYDNLTISRAVPGNPLSVYFPHNESESLTIACQLIQRLHQAMITHDALKFITLAEFLMILDTAWPIPLKYLSKARELRDKMLQTAKKQQLLHGDLHQDNILSHGEKWVVIGPKALLGEHEYDLATYIINPCAQLVAQKNALAIMQKRIRFFSKRLNLSKERIINWCFIQAVLNWAFALEDNLVELTLFEKLVQLCEELTNFSCT